MVYDASNIPVNHPDYERVLTIDELRRQAEDYKATYGDEYIPNMANSHKVIIYERGPGPGIMDISKRGQDLRIVKPLIEVLLAIYNRYPDAKLISEENVLGVHYHPFGGFPPSGVPCVELELAGEFSQDGFLKVFLTNKYDTTIPEEIEGVRLPGNVRAFLQALVDNIAFTEN